MRRKFKTALLIGCLLPLFPSLAAAACVQSDLEGIWQFYGRVISWRHCKITVQSAGAIEGVCRNAEGNLGPTSGLFRLLSAGTCTFTGRLLIGGNRYDVTHGTLSRDKLEAAGVGEVAGMTGFNELTFTMIKR